VETRRLLIAFVLSILFLIAWQQIFPPPEPPPRDLPPAESIPGDEPDPSEGEPERPAAALPEESAFETSSSGNLGEEGLGEESLGEDRVAEPEETGAPAPILEEIAADFERRPVIETELFRAEFTNRGAQLVSFRLKRHLTHEGEELELVRARGDDPYPFALVDRDGRALEIGRALFTVEERRDDLGRDEIHFRYRGASGDAEKVFRDGGDGFLEIAVRFQNGGDWWLLAGPGARELTLDEEEDRFLERQVGFRLRSELETADPGDIEGERVLPAEELSWVSLEDKYFLKALVPQVGLREVVVRRVLQRSEVPVEGRRFLPAAAEDSEDGLIDELEVLLAPGDDRLEITAYLGAKKYSRLLKLPYGLEETVRWGFFGLFTKPLYHGLQWIYSNVASNYGWAIVLMTFLIKLVFFPLTHKSQVSMGKMQELNPKVQAIRSRYKPKLKDKQGRPNLDAQRQMNEEVMAVYKSAGVNPAAGCLPLILQIPVFFAFYKLLIVAVELRNAPWILWIKDLSTPDPIWILPIAMGVSGLALQRLTPTAPDPMQRRIMQIMPIAFTFFAFAFPSGLVLYWLTNNLLTMVQQAFYLRHKKKSSGQEAKKAGKPAAEKKAEKKGKS